MTQAICSDNKGAAILIDVLASKGVREVVLSPGSRNAPLVLTVAHDTRLHHTVIVDERSAAFYALGLAQQLNQPVALICTSGTALLNYAPAAAEAYYQQIPLIVISADRPTAWIDQEDSQTIRQHKALSNFVKESYQFPDRVDTDESCWYANRIANDAINHAMHGRRGTVHINIPLAEPLYKMTTKAVEPQRLFCKVDSVKQLPIEAIEKLAQSYITSPRVMIVAGFNAPDCELTEALLQLAALDNTVVLTENISNLRNEAFVTTIDRVLELIDEADKAYTPDLLISFGGSLVSRRLKAYLRNYPPREHWSIDVSEHPADTFTSLTTQIALPATAFLKQLTSEVSEVATATYKTYWERAKQQASVLHREYEQQAVWSDWKACSILFSQLPANSYLQLSNGTSIRYAQLFEHPHIYCCDCNRGTSGIDGSTSTAMGAAAAHPDSRTILLTGDISFVYDSNAFWIKSIPPTMRIVVLRNGGGGIFRYIIPQQREKWEETMEGCFETAMDIDVESIAKLHRWHYLKATNEEELTAALTSFTWIENSDKAVLLDLETPRMVNDKVLKEYFAYLRWN